jgi:hypothetical protein
MQEAPAVETFGQKIGAAATALRMQRHVGHGRPPRLLSKSAARMDGGTKF